MKFFKRLLLFFHRLFWSRKHKKLIGVRPEEIINDWRVIFPILAQASEEDGTELFYFGKVQIRLAGSTIVLNETWAINPYEFGIYVHKRVNDRWEIVYRSYRLMSDFGFTGLLHAIRGEEGFRALSRSVDDPLNVTAKAVVD